MPYPVVSWYAAPAERAAVEAALVAALTRGVMPPIRFFEGLLLVRDTTAGSVERVVDSVDTVMRNFNSGRAFVTPGRQGSSSACWTAEADRDAAVPFVNVRGRNKYPELFADRPPPPTVSPRTSSGPGDDR